jgi:hypothetical protein
LPELPALGGRTSTETEYLASADFAKLSARIS